MDLEKKIDELNGVIELFKKENNARLAEVEKKGSESSARAEKMDKLDKEITRLQDEIKATQTAMNRIGQNDGGKDARDEKSAKHLAALTKYMRKGDDTELKAMSVDSDVDGGFLVTPQMSSEIVKKVFESSPMRQLASVQTISSDAFEILQDLDEAGANWVGEGTTGRGDTSTPTFKKLVIPVHELEAEPKTTQKLLDDAAINLESWLAEKVSSKFARSEATAFISGNGVLKPRGILSYASGTGFEQIEQVNSGHATQILANGLLDLQGSLKEAYQANASFLMERASVTAIRKLVDLNGQYIWQPGLQPGAPDMLLNKPLYHADDMETVGAGALAIAYGDFRQGYQIVDRIGIRVIRDIYTVRGAVVFVTTKRVGGGVKNFEAIKLQKISA